MCEAIPGPRCASHTNKVVKREENKVEKIKVRLKELETDFSQTLAKADSEEPAMSLSMGSLTETYYELDHAEKQLLEAKRAYWTTPEGQKELQTFIDTEEDETKKSHYQHELDKAQTTRNNQTHCLSMVRKAQSNLDDVSQEQATSWLSDELELAVVGINLSQNEIDIRSSHQELQAAQDEEKKALGALRTSLQVDVRKIHDELAVKIRNTYVENGVDKELANHYAKDAIESMKGKVKGHLTTDGKNPVYALHEEISFKASTPAAEQAVTKLKEDAEIAEHISKAKDAHEKYNSLIDPVLDSRLHTRELADKGSQLASTREEMIQRQTDLKRELLHKQALIATGEPLTSKQLYRVDSKQFAKSAYTQPDGSSNAFVLEEGFSTAVPVVYSRVVGVKVDDSGKRVIKLESGKEIDGVAAKHCNFVIFKPENGAVKLF